MIQTSPPASNRFSHPEYPGRNHDTKRALFQANLLDRVSDAFISTDLNLRILSWNDAATSIYGWRAQEALGRSIATLLPTRFPDDTPRNAYRTLMTLGRWEGEVIQRRKDGTGIFVFASATLLRNNAGEPIGAVFVNRDINARKRVETKESGQKEIFRMIAEGLPLDDILDALASFIEEMSPVHMLCSILQFDENSQTLVHVSSRSIPESFYRVIDRLQVDPCDTTMGAAAFHLKRVCDPDLSRAASWEKYREIALSHRLYACWSVPITGSAGQLLGVFGMYYAELRMPVDEDIKLLEMASHLAGIAIERDQSRDRLVAAKEKAEEMNRLKSTFLANMSHEIRTPLTSVIGYAELISNEIDEPHREFAHMIYLAGKRLLDTMNSVLSLAQLQGGSLRIHLDRAEIHDEVLSTVHFFDADAREKGLRLTFTRTEDHPIYVRLDRLAFGRIMVNLIGNAIKFTPEGSISIAVRVDQTDVVIEVKDTGIGINEDFLPRIFDEFQQESAGDNRVYEGNGLGLAITRHLLEMMNGRITVSSKKGEGSTFKVFLPLCDDSDYDPELG